VRRSLAVKPEVGRAGNAREAGEAFIASLQAIRCRTETLVLKEDTKVHTISDGVQTASPARELAILAAYGGAKLRIWIRGAAVRAFRKTVGRTVAAALLKVRAAYTFALFSNGCTSFLILLGDSGCETNEICIVADSVNGVRTVYKVVDATKSAAGKVEAGVDTSECCAVVRAVCLLNDTALKGATFQRRRAKTLSIGELVTIIGTTGAFGYAHRIEGLVAAGAAGGANRAQEPDTAPHVGAIVLSHV
ncbi:Hypothetical protein POVN_LOCUS300, partial [uncultured virus]